MFLSSFFFPCCRIRSLLVRGAAGGRLGRGVGSNGGRRREVSVPVGVGAGHGAVQRFHVRTGAVRRCSRGGMEITKKNKPPFQSTTMQTLDVEPY